MDFLQNQDNATRMYGILHQPSKSEKYFADLKNWKKYDNFVNTIKQDIQMSDHIGTIGETIELDVTITDAFG